MTEDKKIKIMHFVHSLNEGGIERLLLEICRGIDNRKFEIQICCLIEKGSIYQEFEKENIKLHFIKAHRDFKIKNIIPNLLVLIKITKLLKKEKIDITHGHEFFSTVFSRIAALTAGVKKKYITLHNVYYWWSTGVHKSQNILSKFTTRIICNSKATLNYSIKHDRISADKYLLIYNGINCNKFSPGNYNKKTFTDELGINEKSYICMSVGSISVRKGFQNIISTAILLKESFKEMVFIIVGDRHILEEDEYNKICRLINENKLNQNVIITGNRNDINIILNFCDLFIMPSVAEGFGLALAEAMATEKVCIASDIEVFKEIITDGENGFFYNSKVNGALANKIKELKTADEGFLKEIKFNARKRIKDNFNSVEMIKQYEKIYSE